MVTDQKEKARLATLRQYNILDTLPEEDLDALVKLASEICQVPIALISLIDEDRQWFKANIGMKGTETPRNTSFCHHAIQGNEIYEIENAAEDEKFANNPNVTGDPNVRFYAGAPLTSPDGYNIGTLCVIDTKPKRLTSHQKASLRTLSRFVISNFELRKAKQEIDQSKQHYQSLVEQAVDIIYTCNMKGAFTFVSPAIEGITGYKSSELLGRHFTELVSPDHRGKVRRFYTDQFRKNITETRHEFRVVTLNGEEKWIEQTVVLSEKDGKKVGFHGVVRDMNERRKFVEQLKQANRRFEKIFGQSPVAMTLASSHPSKFIDVNESFTELTGFTLMDVNGLDSKEAGLLSDPDRKKMLSVYKREGTIRNYETKIRSKTGEEKWVLLSTEHIDQGGKTYILGIYINISVRKKKEQELLQTKDLLAEAMRIGRIGSFENDLRAGKMNWSREIFDIMDMNPWSEALNLEEFMKALQPEDRLAAAQRIHNSVQTLQPFSAISRVTTATGRTKWIELRAVPITDKEGRLSHFRGTMQDITESKELQQELIRAKEQAEELGKAKELFLANMSHEIRTPMNAVLGFTDLLSETKLDKMQKEYLHAIDTSGRNLMIVINDILDYSKIEAGMLAIEQMPMSIRSIFSSLAVSFGSEAAKKGLKLSFESDKKIPEVLGGDPARLTQIIVNLLGNAIKFTPKGSIKVKAVLLKTKAEKAWVEFSVKDSGIGIHKDQLAFVFERFNQGSNDTTRKYGGTGLGLSIVKKLAELQGGSVSLESTINRGSTFRVTIPYNTNVKMEESRKQPGKKAKAKQMDISLLLVEDNKLNQKLAEKVLQDFGFKTDIAENGKIALQKLTKKNYDVVLMDMQMPVMNGYEATEAIRKKLKSPIPIIAMTAHAMASEKEKCLKLGMNDYISKPFKKEDLYSKIVEVINESRNSDVGPEKSPGFDNTEYLDLDTLKDLSAGSEEFIIEVLGIFVKETGAELKRLNKAVTDHNYKTIRELSHKLKTSIGLVGLKSMLPVLDELERLGEQKKQISRVKVLFKQFHRTCLLALKEAAVLAKQSQSF